jgi:hypothetical protein
LKWAAKENRAKRGGYANGKIIQKQQKEIEDARNQFEEAKLKKLFDIPL